jgi:hypothetical protein
VKKVPTIFERDKKTFRVTPVVAEDLEWFVRGEGVATVKYDGSCCAVFDGEL